MAKIKKAQMGMKAPKAKASKDSVESEMFPGKMIPRSQSNYENKNIRRMLEKPSPAKKVAKPAAAPAKKAVPAKKMMYGGMAKAASGKKFPDLTGDGKVTKADILKGRGVFKSGGKVKMKKGGKMKACKYGC